MFERLKSLLIRPPANRRNRGARAARSASPASARLEALRRWIVWLLLLAAWIAAAVALLGYQSADPAWSTSGRATSVRNWLGPPGAWASDIAYFVFGATVWWLLAFAALAIWRAMPRVSLFRPQADEADETGDWAPGLSLPWRLGGLALLIASNSAQKAVAMHR